MESSNINLVQKPTISLTNISLQNNNFLKIIEFFSENYIFILEDNIKLSRD